MISPRRVDRLAQRVVRLALIPGLLGAIGGGVAAQESYLGIHSELPSFFADEDAFEVEDDALSGGVEIASVVENSPAEAAGLKPGDVLRRINGAAVRSPRHATAIVSALAPGSPLRLEAERGGELLELEAVTVERLVPYPPPTVRAFVDRRRIGVVVEEVGREIPAARTRTTGGASETRTSRVSATAREDESPRFPTAARAPLEVRVERAPGVRIRRFLDGSPAGAVGLARGDVVLQINGELIHGGEDFLVLLEAIEPGERVELIVERAGRMRIVRLSAFDPGRYVRTVFVPLIVDYEADRTRDATEFGILPFNLIKYEREGRRKSWRFLWLIRFGSDESDEMRDVE